MHLYNMRFILPAFLLYLVCSCGYEPARDPDNVDPKLVSFESGGKFGFKDTAGNIVIPAVYDGVYEFDTNYVTGVVDSTGWLVINKKGEHVLNPFVFDNGPDYFSEGLARFVENGKMGFFDGKGLKVIPARYDFATPFKYGLASACNGCSMSTLDEEHSRIDGGKWGMIDRQGRDVIPFLYDGIIHFDKDSVTIREAGKWYKLCLVNGFKKEIAAPDTE